MTKVKLNIPIGELFSFLGINAIGEYEIKRDIKIKTSIDNYVPIKVLIKKEGYITKYVLNNDTHITCDDNHLVKSVNDKFKHINTLTELQTINGVCKIINKIGKGYGNVYDMSLDAPHEYITSSGVICHNTTSAKVIVSLLDCDYIYINASDENNVETIRTKIKQFVSTISFKKWKIVILDEGDQLSAAAQSILRALTEEFSKSARFILTCNYPEKIIKPLISRFQVFNFKTLPKQDMAMYMASILDRESVTYDIADIVKIVNKYYPDLRKIINISQQYTNDNNFQLPKDEAIEYGFSEKVIEILNKNTDKKKKYEEVRQFFADNQLHDYTPVYKYLYEHIEELKLKSFAQAIINIADAQYKDVFVVDKTINVVSLILQIIDLYE